ncbi:MAG: hypothetical protein M3Q69_14770, partial [Acidobacteriota bacterium]|nr:hypothetical protein [Acidobacteriota bacterium]
MRHAVALLVVFLLAAVSLSAATFEQPVTDAALLARAEVVVVATVTGSTPRTDAARMIYTDHRFRVEQVLKGDLAAHETIIVSEVGGAANGRGVAVAGAPSYTPGTRVVAFLRQRADGTYFTAGMAHGAFRFERASDGRELLVRDMSDIEGSGSDEVRDARVFVEGIRRNDADALHAAAVSAASIGVPATNASASSYVLFGNGKPLRWKCNSACTIDYTVGSPQQGTVDTALGVQNAMAAWTNEPNAWITLDVGGFNSQTGVDDDQRNDIVFNSTANPTGGFCDGSIGCAIIYFNDAPFQHTFDNTLFNDIESSDVLIRPGTFSQSFFEAIIAHELGHSIGLKDVSNTTAVMNGNLPANATASLKTYDRAAVSSVYGNGATTPSCDPPAISGTTGGGTVNSGSTKTLSVTVTGTSPFTYQWYNGTSGDTSNPVGTNSASYTTPPITSTQNFWVKVTSQCGQLVSVNSNTITVSPATCTPPTITGTTGGGTIASGGTRQLSVTATGTAPFTYQWYRGTSGDTSTPVGGNSDKYTTPAITSTTSFWVRVSNACSTNGVNSPTITLTTEACTAPSITSQPLSQSIAPNSTATLTIGVTPANVSVTWYRANTVGDDANPVGTGTTYTTPALTTTTSYWARVTNNCNSVNSALATVTVSAVCAAPTIASQPGTVPVKLGDGATLTVTAAGTAPFTYQWYEGDAPVNTKPIAGATSASLVLPAFTKSGTVKYWVRVTNACGSVPSQTITVNVSCAPAVAPVIALPPLVGPSSTKLDIRWTSPSGNATGWRFEVQESTSPNFETARTLPLVSEKTDAIIDKPAVTTDTRYFYRVRAISNCSGEASAYSTPGSVVIQALTTPVIGPNGGFLPSFSVDANLGGDVNQPVLIGGFPKTNTAGYSAAANDTFTITFDQPWVTATPSSGTLPPEGVTINLRIDTSGLPVGSSGATMRVIRSEGPTSQYTSLGTTSIAIPVSISKVTPVSPVARDAMSEGTLIIPAVAHADGVGTRFQSDVRIANATAEAITYLLNFTPSGRDGTQEGKRTTITVPANSTFALDDLVQVWFGSGILGETGTGTLEVRPQSTASGTTPNALATFASSRLYAISDKGTLGQFIPALTADKFVSDLSKDALGTISLQQIAQSTAYRTNLGFVEGSGAPVEMLVTLRDGANNILAQKSMGLAAYEHRQTSLGAFFPGVNVTDGRVEVQVVSSTGKATAYASVLDNKTSDPLLVFPEQAARANASTYVVPGVAELDNGAASNFHTDMRIFNAAANAVNVTLKYFPQGSSNAQQSVT